MKFITNKKQEFLDGRPISYYARQINLSIPHLTNIINGKTHCKSTTAMLISIYKDKDLHYYFKEM